VHGCYRQKRVILTIKAPCRKARGFPIKLTLGEKMEYLALYLTLCVTLGLVVECTTEFLVKDNMIHSLRVFIIRNLYKLNDHVAEFFAELLSCGRCMSGWVSLPMSILVASIAVRSTLAAFLDTRSILVFLYLALVYFSTWMLTWRFSNMWHFLVHRLNRKN
jgi:hypothetical protein